MRSREFVYWMQGYFEILAPAMNDSTLSKEQVAVIRKHLDLVFKHEIDPEGGDAKQQEVLNQIHSGNPPTGVMHGVTSASDILIRC